MSDEIAPPPPGAAVQSKVTVPDGAVPVSSDDLQELLNSIGSLDDNDGDDVK